MPDTVIIRGYRETLAALQRVNRDVKRDIAWELAEAARPVARSAQARIAKYQGASIATIGPRVAAQGVFVTQRAAKVTGLRPDFGALQMVKGMIPALEEEAPNIERRVLAAVDQLVATFGA